VSTGYSQQQYGAFNKWKTRLWEVAALNFTSKPQTVSFTPKCNLPPLDSYKGKFPDGFWDPCTTAGTQHAGLIDGEALHEMAAGVHQIDRQRLDRVVQRAKFGADIGCKGIFRTPTSSSNAPDAYVNGRQVTDAVGTWIQKGLVHGPVSEDDLPPQAKVSGIMTRTKPDGSVRIILNLSAPKGLSVNDGIDADEFPAVMSSTEQWLGVLNKAGHGCWM
jgi:hypothetical protein